MLRQAEARDQALIEALWRAPANANWIEPPEAGEVGDAIAQGLGFLWEAPGQPTGLAMLMTWVPRVMGLSAIACPQGQGTPFLRAVLGQVFGPMNAHRIGLDVTADNARAIALYEKLGFQREGVLRECWQRPAGDWTNCLLMGLLARDWQP